MLDHFQSDDVNLALDELSRLDMKALGRRWRTLVGGSMPTSLGRVLVLRVLSYQAQVQRYGDLDRASRVALGHILVGTSGRSSQQGIDGVPQTALRGTQSRLLRPGSVLTREYAGAAHRVVVVEAGFSWNGKVYDSLSKVALAITGTRWNGPRFFGLREGSQRDHNRPSQKPRLDVSSAMSREAP